MDLTGKVAVVTGGAMGIGYAICEVLAKQGASIMIADLDGRYGRLPETAPKRIPGPSCRCGRFQRAGHRTHGSKQYRAVQRTTPVNNAAIYRRCPSPSNSLQASTTGIRCRNVNVIGQFLCCKAVLLTFKKQGSGRIINISSGVAFKGNPGMLHYVASKGAIVSMTRTLATELGEHGVLVNSVAPGFILSDGRSVTIPNWRTPFPDFPCATGRLKRDMLAGDVVGAVAFFAGPHAAFITGQTLVVDGGAYYH